MFPSSPGIYIHLYESSLLMNVSCKVNDEPNSVIIKILVMFLDEGKVYHMFKILQLFSFSSKETHQETITDFSGFL